MYNNISPVIKLKRWQSITLFSALLSPMILVLLIFSGSGFAPSPTVNAISNWFGIIIGILWLSLWALIFFSIKKETTDHTGKNIKKSTIIAGALLCPLLFTGMYSSGFKFTLGNLLHSFFNEKCHFTRHITTKRTKENIIGHAYTINLKGSEDIPLNWHISGEEYKDLPTDIKAIIYASQSIFGVKMEKLIPEKINLPEINANYQKQCKTTWILHSSKKQKQPFLYWY